VLEQLIEQLIEQVIEQVIGFVLVGFVVVVEAFFIINKQRLEIFKLNLCKILKD